MRTVSRDYPCFSNVKRASRSLGSWSENFVLSRMVIGGRSETSDGGRWVENFVFVRMPVCGLCRKFIPRECTEDFMDSRK